MSEVFQKQLERVLERGIGSDPTLNPFWGSMVGKLHKAQRKYGTLSAVTLAQNINARAERLAPGLTNATDPEVARVLALLDQPDQVEPKQADHVAGLWFVRARKLLKLYLSDMDALELRSGQQNVRTWWYRHRLRQHVRKGSAKPFLEIGSGSGHFAVMAIAAGMASHYVFVDLPEVLLHAIATVTDLLPDRPSFVGQAPDFSGPPALWFLNPDEIDLVPDRSVAALMNFNSFSEMDEGVRDRYFEHLYRTAAPGALFYNVNRRHRAMTRLDGSPFENHPMRYPYRTDDEVIEWEPDEYQQATRSRMFSTPQSSFCISRICRIR